MSSVLFRKRNQCLLYNLFEVKSPTRMILTELFFQIVTVTVSSLRDILESTRLDYTLAIVHVVFSLWWRYFILE